MQSGLTFAEVVELVRCWSEEYLRQRETLIQMDQRVGDGDLGITMQKAFSAAAALHPDESKGIGHYFMQCGLAMAQAAPSTMGTLMATGFMRGGKALSIDSTLLDTAGLHHFFHAFTTGIAERGKAQPGEKTVLDILLPACVALSLAVQRENSLAEAVQAGFWAARQGLEETRQMTPQHGKAAVFAASSQGLADPGGAAALILFTVLNTFVRQ